MYLVDTSVISEARKRDRADAGVKTFLRKAAQDDVDLYLSVVTIGELRRGVEIIRHRGDNAQATQPGNWRGGVPSEFGQSILDVDAEIGQLWGRLRVPHSEHALDKVIGVTALISRSDCGDAKCRGLHRHGGPHAEPV